VSELVTTLRHADSLVSRMRGDASAAAIARQVPVPAASQHEPFFAGRAQANQAPIRPEVAAARSWFAGTSVGVILLVLGALCVLAAGAVFIAVAWTQLPLAIRALILVTITAGFALLTLLALRRGLQATAEAMAAIAAGMFVLDLAAARRAGLPGLADLDSALYAVVAGGLLAAASAGAALSLRTRGRWLWSLDAAVAVGLARAAFGALRLSDGEYAVTSVSVAVAASLLYAACRRLRLPVAMWSVLGLGFLGWLVAVGVGAEQAADHVGSDPGRVGQAWPALTMALLAGGWSMRLTHPVWRRVASCLCLAPVLLVFEIVGWSHGWVVGAAVMLAGYAVAALTSAWASRAWSPAVAGSAALLGVSAMVGLVPNVVALITRMSLAVSGSWPASLELPPDLAGTDVAPWLLPLTAVFVLGLLPRVTIDSGRLPFEQRYTAGVFVAALGLLPMLYDAGFWLSMVSLVVAAVAVIGAARRWRSDVLLLMGLSLLAVLRICAFYDDLADPLAWTVIAVVCLAWALLEIRPMVRAGFLTLAGLFALAAAAQWLTYLEAPSAVNGLVIVTVGSLGLLASQSLGAASHPSTRLVGEGLSVTWVVAGMAMADGSPSHRAVELTVAGVAAGITAYISGDRRRAGWVSGVLLTAASWVRLMDNDIQAVEWYTLPAATSLLVYGVRRFRNHPAESTWRCLGPGLALAVTPSLLVALDEPVTWRGLVVGLASVALLTAGVQLRLAAPFALGVAATGLLALRNVWPVAAFIPRWALLFVIGAVLLWAGMTWESRVKDVRTARRYVRGLR